MFKLKKKREKIWSFAKPWRRMHEREREKASTVGEPKDVGR